MQDLLGNNGGIRNLRGPYFAVPDEVYPPIWTFDPKTETRSGNSPHFVEIWPSGSAVVTPVPPVYSPREAV